MRDPDGLRYHESGVDIDASDELLRALAPAIARTRTDRVIRGVGHFGGFIRIGPGSENMTLVASIDGVGTKLKIAALAGDHRGVGHDIVNHCINDILAGGAHPICFLDYFATGQLDVKTATIVIEGIADACALHGIPLLGGETAEMPGIYSPGDYDVAGVVLGLVSSERIIDGTSIRPGDRLIGLPSSGFHTNGYSLIRAALGLNESADGARARLAEQLPWDAASSIGEALLEPHRSYFDTVSPLLDRELIHGMAHITGGGIAGNLSRIVPDGMTALVDTASWDVPRLTEYVAELGHISQEECYRVFNMGIGYIVVVRNDDTEMILDEIAGSMLIGEIRETSAAWPRVELSLG